jgi:WD40 repeat protein/serine/threonine protein kinase
VPDHELLRCIGRGAYGAVWLARNVMGTYRAVKLVQREDFGRDRPFTREYEGLVKFEPISRSHPNLMQILHVGRREEYFYYVTELADDASAEPSNAELGTRSAEQSETSNAELGTRSVEPASPAEAEGKLASVGCSVQQAVEPESAEDVLRSAFRVPPSLDPQLYVPRTLQEDLERRGRQPVRDCVSLATALASALKHLHDHNLVHRDVKPSNVIFVHGVPKLADIGLVTTVGDSRSIVGTEGYLPPEGPGSPQADLYALGKLLYEVSTGMNRSEYPRLPQNLRDLPDAASLLEFNEVLLRACAKDTDRRYQRADDLLADLALLERGASIKRLRRLERHHTVLRRIGVGLLVVGLLVSAAWWQSWRAHRIARRHLAQLHVNEGTQRLAQGDYAAALPWLVGALELDADDPVRERAHRVRIASALERCPLPVAHFSVPQSKVLAADLNRDGTVLATGHKDGEVRLWDTRSGARIQQLAHRFPVVLCQFLPPEDRMLTATVGQKAHLWELTKPGSGPLSFDQEIGFDSAVYALGLNERLGRAYLSKGRYRFARTHTSAERLENLTLGLRLTGEGESLRIHYEVRRTGPERVVLQAGDFTDSANVDAFDDGLDEPADPIWGQAILVLENGSFGDEPGESSQVIWDNVRVRRYAVGEPPTPWRMVDDFSSDALTNWVHLAPALEERTARLENGRLVLSCQRLPQVQTVRGVCWLELFEISRHQTIEVEADLVSAQAPHPMVTLGLAHPNLSPATAPDWLSRADGRWLVLTWWDGVIRLWDLEQERFATVEDGGQTFPLKLQPGYFTQDLDLSPSGRYVAHVTLAGRVSVWDVRSGREVALEGLGLSEGTGVRFSPDARFLVVSHANGLELIRTGDWRPIRSLGPGAPYSQPRFSPSGGRLAAVRETREVVVWDLGDPAEPPVAFVSHFEVNRIAFSPDGRYVAVGSADGLARVCDAVRREPFGPPLPGALGRFSADGTRLLLFGAGGGVWLWDLSGVMDNTLAVPPLRAERTFAVSSDGRLTAKIVGQGISIKTVTSRYTLESPSQVPLRRVAFSPDNQHLIAEASDLRTWIWDLSTRTLTGPPRPMRYEASLAYNVSPHLAVEDRDRGRLSDLAALLGGQRPNGEGGMTPVDEEERVRLLSELGRVRPPDFGDENANRARWHREQALAAEQAMDWAAAVFHWEWAQTSTSGVEAEEDGISPEARQAYAREAAERVRRAMVEGRSRWSVILPRPAWANSGMLDLGRHYTRSLGEPPAASPATASFRELASGVQVLGARGFDVRGIIQLTRTNRVTIPVGRACQRIHFLHAANPTTVGTRALAGRYQVTYASGEKVAVDLWSPEDVPPYAAGSFIRLSQREWRGLVPGLHCCLAWAGSVRGARQQADPIFLTRMTWDLPNAYQGQVVETLELQAALTGSTPLVFAITVE